MQKIIRLGDTLREFGGEVTSAAKGIKIKGKAPACKGDTANCHQHGPTRIAEGSPRTRFGGAEVALDGHHCECGCTLVSSMPEDAD
ncbi:putative Zn-binding protein involved in type VI secretion [Silvimonas terrae]|uniref:Putative Zn-binding protein involved in type VI secretion n=1 Tax=Silvimonas terrae TaxID=300266 RepID=A0A840RGH0_9NEIS|nr:PAAR domain-containing protein [Silvimonas terrae]MBB5191618.1 putative Zn-binding protein involved in type VI secretion [Silvimonas terrae]